MRKKKLDELKDSLVTRPFDSNVDMRGVIIFVAVIAVLVIVFVPLIAFKMI